MRVLILVIPIVVGLFAFNTVSQVFADSLQGASKQRIGNYDVEMTTQPKTPTSGSPTRILIRIAGVDGNDLVDVPIVIRIVKDGTELQRTVPIIVPYGHYTHRITFPQSGKYVLYVDLSDNNYAGQTLTFTFFINVAGPLDFLYIVVPLGAVFAIGAVGSILFIRKWKKKQADRTELKE
jgi:ABC-type antimicrobial peptide transport system permease subunit